MCRRFIWIMILMAIPLLLIGCSNPAPTVQKKEFNVYVLKNGSEHANSINQQIKKGIELATKEMGNLKIEFSEQIKNVDEAQIILKRFLKSNADFIIASDPSYYNIIKVAAIENEKVKFAVIDTEVNVDEIPNVVNYRFRDVEMGFLMGFMTSKLSKSGKALLLGATEDDRTNVFIRGFERGVDYAEIGLSYDVKFLGSFQNSYENAEYANTLSTKYYLNGYDIVAQCIGKASRGVFDAAANQKFVFGFGVDQTADVIEQSKKIFYASVIKRYDSASL